MTSQEVLQEIISRIVATGGENTFFTSQEILEWPADFTKEAKENSLLVSAPPATSITCPGCEEKCTMPVNTSLHPKHGSSSFIVCDKRADINRVPVQHDQINQWRTSADSIAALIARLLGIVRIRTAIKEDLIWEIGLFKGKKHSHYLRLKIIDRLLVDIAGNHIFLEELLGFENSKFVLDRTKIIRKTDNPAAAHIANKESSESRKARLYEQKNTLLKNGVSNFREVIAAQEGITTTRISQLISSHEKNLISKPKKTSKSSSNW